MKKNRILVICGPTATGKTDIAYKLAREYDSEIVSADSRQIYEYMDIGTGKDIPPGSRKVIHRIRDKADGRVYDLAVYETGFTTIWMYDLVKPNERYSAGQYRRIATNVIKDIWKRKKTVVIVGGTGLYIQALFNPLSMMDYKPDYALRKELAGYNAQQLGNILSGLDEPTFLKLNESDRNNPRRLIRKIEIAKYKGMGLEKKKDSVYIDPKDMDKHVIGMESQLKVLYARIDKRVGNRLEQGHLEEIRKLMEMGYGFGDPSFDGLGYRQWREYFTSSGNMDDNKRRKLKDKIIQIWKFAEHAYARRQLTWFKKQKDINWFDISEQSSQQRIIGSCREWYNNK